jgi:hypothetical protein
MDYRVMGLGSPVYRGIMARLSKEQTLGTPHMRILAGEALLLCFLTSAIVWCGACCRRWLVDGDQVLPLLDSLRRFDAIHYQRIVVAGYDFHPARRSEVAFFPAYPLAARAMVCLTGLSPLGAMLLTSNGFLAGAFVLLAWYLQGRTPTEPEKACAGNRPAEIGEAAAGMPRTEAPYRGSSSHRSRRSTYVLLAFGLGPATFFFRMPYAESTFLFFSLLSFYAMQRRWPVALVALCVGITTACRPVGVALLPPFLLHVWHGAAFAAQRAYRILILTPVACWGIAAFVVFQYLRFGEAIAFVNAQDHWVQLVPVSTLDKCLALLSWEPIWSVYDPDRPACYWRRWPPPSAVFNCQFMNPIFFVGTAAVIALGTWRRWLDGYETLLSVGLLLIPYVTKGYDNAMLSHGRFAAVVFPAYLVAGHLLQRAPRAVAWTILGTSGFFMSAYAALFAAGYPFF